MNSERSRTSEIAIRQALAEDRATLTALMLGSSAYQGRYRAMIENYPVTADMVDRGEVWIAESDGETLGFYRLDLAKSDLDLMFVADRAQGLGVGRLLFEHMKQFAARAGLPAIGIIAHPPAADFYRKMGAIETGVRKASGPQWWDRTTFSVRLAA